MPGSLVLDRPSRRGPEGYARHVERQASATRPAVDQFVVVITTGAFDASLAFYRDVIGLEVVEEWTDAYDR